MSVPSEEKRPGGRNKANKGERGTPRDWRKWRESDDAVIMCTWIHLIFILSVMKSN